MPASLITADSLLTVDVGTVTTRAALFDVVEGGYRFIASGQAPSTAAAPYRNVAEGVHQAIGNLQTVTGRILLGGDQRLIIPAQDGAGVDHFTATMSAGPALKTVVVGLLNDYSLESIQRLARSTYARVLDLVSLNDRRKPEEQIDSILRLQPDLLLIAGGTDGGATRSIDRLVELVGLACYLLPADKRPVIVYAGNQDNAVKVRNTLGPWTPSLHISPNILPRLETEDIQPAQRALVQAYAHIRRSQTGGLDDLAAWSDGSLLPTGYAHGRMVRFLGQIYGGQKGILGVDLGASAATISAAFQGRLVQGIYPHFGLGEGLGGILRHTSLESILRWLPLDIPAETVRDYIYQKAIYPASLPATVEDLAIEQALARQNLSLAMQAAAADFPAGIPRPAPDLTPAFEPALAGGSVFAAAPTLGQSLLMLLDGIQPTGVTTMILDQNNLLPALGAAAGRSPILSVQVLESGAFLGLATVISVVSGVRPNTPVLRLRLSVRGGAETQVEVRQGALELIQLPPGQAGQASLQPLHHADAGFGAGRGGQIPVSGTALGLVIDARGRPLRLAPDPARRREMIKKWLYSLGG
ncbi:MAG: hypothetical protein FJZ96_01340 [Chloroflexi bacterium]|nr:hypothetical protein [Chloroflexota bacterium]